MEAKLAQNDYPIEKPKPPVTIWLLGFVIDLALIALGIAAFTAFSNVTGFWQALFSAAAIEIAGIVEAIALVRGRNWIGIGGIALTLLVSGTYNYIQAEQAGKVHDITNPWQLGTLAFGPLLALTVLALTVGYELRRHEQAVKTWQNDRADWLIGQAAERRQADEAMRQEERRALEMQMQLDYQKEKLRLENEARIAEAKAVEERKAEVARVRIEAKRKAQVTPQEEAKETKVSSDWRTLPDEDKRIIAAMSTPEICKAYSVSQRTAQNWRNWAQVNGNGNGKPQQAKG